MTEKEKNALAIAVKAIYFDDSSDYQSLLWEIVTILGGDEASNLLEEDAQEAFDKYCL